MRARVVTSARGAAYHADRSCFRSCWLSQAVHVHVGNAASAPFLRKLTASQPVGFDVVVDLRSSDELQAQTLKLLWRSVRPNGVYVLQGVGEECADSRRHPACDDDSARSVTTLLKDVVDTLNRDFHNGPSWDNVYGVVGVGRSSLFEKDAAIASLVCFSHVCALRALSASGQEYVLGQREGCSSRRLPALPLRTSCCGDMCSSGVEQVWRAFDRTPATKERHCYSFMYADLMGRYACTEDLGLLEIGVDMGGSLNLWRAMFPRVSLSGIEGGDTNGIQHAQNQKREAAALGVAIHLGDQADAAFLETVVAATPTHSFDIVVDDGGHRTVQQNTSLHLLWKTVRPGGLYTIEDLETSYYSMAGEDPLQHVGGAVGIPGTAIAMFKHLIDRVSFGPDGVRRTDAVLDDTRSAQFADVDRIAAVYCFRNMCALRKQPAVTARHAAAARKAKCSPRATWMTTATPSTCCDAV